MTDRSEVAPSPAENDKREPWPGRSRFVCPYCEAYAAQSTGVKPIAEFGGRYQEIPGSWRFTVCASCNRAAAWNGSVMVWPSKQFGPLAPTDLPSSIGSIYEEARAVGNASPRSAAALLRLCLEELVNELEPGNDRLNDKVGTLVAQGMPAVVQQAMDALRVFGNNGAHVGEIDLSDDRETVLALFQVLEMVVEHVITRRNQVAALYARLPSGARNAIERRDAQKS